MYSLVLLKRVLKSRCEKKDFTECDESIYFLLPFFMKTFFAYITNIDSLSQAISPKNNRETKNNGEKFT